MECAHCYLSASAGADTRGELTTEECRRVIDEIAVVNPNVFLILTGGEPFLRKDLFEVAGAAAERGFTTVFGTNGVLLREPEARRMREHRVLGASISLDSTDRARHDAFRRRPGSWDGAVRATRVLTDAGLDFSLHMSVTDWNLAEVPAMIDLARTLGAKVLNFFFLVRTGRGKDLTDIDAAAYERILTYLANTMKSGDREVPYSLVSAVDLALVAPSVPAWGPALAGPREAPQRVGSRAEVGGRLLGVKPWPGRQVVEQRRADLVRRRVRQLGDGPAHQLGADLLVVAIRVAADLLAEDFRAIDQYDHRRLVLDPAWVEPEIEVRDREAVLPVSRERVLEPRATPSAERHAVHIAVLVAGRGGRERGCGDLRHRLADGHARHRSRDVDILVQEGG